VVDDGAPNRDEICSFLKDNFTLAKVYAPENLFQQGAENLIVMGRYNFILLDTCLARWGSHPRFGEWGVNIIPFILENCPETKIIAIGADESENQRMIRNGAHYSVKKGDLLQTQYVKQFLTPLAPLPVIE
jgi:hypothetical protein